MDIDLYCDIRNNLEYSSMREYIYICETKMKQYERSAEV